WRCWFPRAVCMPWPRTTLIPPWPRRSPAATMTGWPIFVGSIRSACVAPPWYRRTTSRRQWRKPGGWCTSTASKRSSCAPIPWGGRNWSDPYYDPLWAEAEKLGIAVGFHEGGEVDLPQTGTHFPNTMMRHTCTHPMAMMLAVVDMIGGGVLERFPTLRVAFLEGNCSWAPFLLWRLDEHWEWRQQWEGKALTMKPSDYFKRQCFLSIECDEEPASLAIQGLGEDYFVFS